VPSPNLQPQQRCRVCGSTATLPAGEVYGKYSARSYALRRCPECHFGFVSDPWTDFAQIYDERYYAGQGADPLVDYAFELSHPDRTVRGYEWRGIAECVEACVGPLGSQRWLDFGCGNGGLVRYLRTATGLDAVGFEEGAIAEQARRVGIPILAREELEEQSGTFDVVTAIEVLEHTLDPVAELRAVRRLLRPGGLLFLTTGNAEPFADRLDRWSYVIPEIHVSFFEPVTLDRAMREAGFRPERRRHGAGFDQILKFKVFKNLRLRRRNWITDSLPSWAIGAAVEPRVRLSAHPVGWAA
jgi:SAM-dependent methyltransferase